MKLGIPNFIPTLGYLFFGGMSTFFIVLLFQKLDTAETGATVFMIVFILLILFMFGLMSYRFKIIFMNSTQVIVIFPFRFQSKKLLLREIDSLDWNLWETHKLGDYRKLTFSTNSGFRSNISDFEFWNYDSLEKWLLDNTKSEYNLKQKDKIELDQAKYNKWLNLVTIPLLIFFWYIFYENPSPAAINPIRIGLQLTITIIIWRLTERLIDYQKRINRNKHNRQIAKN